MTKDDLLALVKKNPISAGCALVSLGLVGAIYFRSGELPDAEDEFGKKSADVARLEANLANSSQLKEQAEIVATASKEVDARLVHVSQQLINYQYFFKLEAETGVKMIAGPSQSIVAPPKGAKPGFLPVPFAVTVQGSLPQLLDYLHRLESGARYCRVMSVTCGVAPTDRGGLVTLALNLELLGVP